ncbi:FAD binding domain [Musa troglodytarum]|uniref:FAD binding domain n=1 Tax=Musa troglodytarum TaxID=320322 RepID=A0A9E7F0Y3_9LILI|nr:FAD binding domain [Musa troglodytarum]
MASQVPMLALAISLCLLATCIAQSPASSPSNAPPTMVTPPTAFAAPPTTPSPPPATVPPPTAISSPSTPPPVTTPPLATPPPALVPIATSPPPAPLAPAVSSSPNNGVPCTASECSVANFVDSLCFCDSGRWRFRGLRAWLCCGRFTTSRCSFSGAGDTRTIPFHFSIARLPRHTQTAPALPMAATTSPSSFSLIRLHPLSSFPSSLRRCRRTISTSRCRAMAPIVASIDNTREEEIVVVGAGIAGLAAALSLHRYFVSSPFRLVARGESLRAGGTSLTLFKNGWRVLDSIGVADELRAQFLQIQGFGRSCLKKKYQGNGCRKFEQ